ncbi:fasciclin domain-containing protein [Dyadobacter sp. LJ53]|uniref:fasciclin domain-containing protein n=1 Tax=Dyadobacter chenwenxiniae TaxID=2906456 RepID=UPI001F2F0BD6|nr:fasciclin domain-containing protein [Dyadobacter chenwenxiniae]MCF0053085.1 fasciclin domain-containing protein [Dyadobacter chenwenxiniae]
MKKNRFVWPYVAFFLLAVLSSGVIISCKEKNEDIVKRKTITEVILENERFSILKDLMIHARMNDDLRTGEVTFFAPDNAAFGRANIFSSSVITALPADSARKLINNHIVGKKRLSYKDLLVAKEKSLTGKELSLTKTDTIFSVNKADIILPDISAANGVIHIIDSLAVR